MAGGGPRVASVGDLGTTWSPLCCEHMSIPRDGLGLAPWSLRGLDLTLGSAT